MSGCAEGSSMGISEDGRLYNIACRKVGVPKGVVDRLTISFTLSILTPREADIPIPLNRDHLP